MRSSVALLTIAACAGIAVAGCSDPRPGNAQPAETTRTTTDDADGSRSATPSRTTESPASSPLDGIEPCELLSDSDRAQLKLEQGKPGRAGRSKDCYWRSTDVWGVGLGFKNDLAFKDANLRGATPNLVNIGRHEAYEVRNAGGGESCEVFIVTSESSFVQVGANTQAGNNTPLACEISNAIAKIIDPKLP